MKFDSIPLFGSKPGWSHNFALHAWHCLRSLAVNRTIKRLKIYSQSVLLICRSYILWSCQKHWISKYWTIVPGVIPTNLFSGLFFYPSVPYKGIDTQIKGTKHLNILNWFLSKLHRQFIGEQKVFSTNGTRIMGCSLQKKLILTRISHLVCMCVYVCVS